MSRWLNYSFIRFVLVGILNTLVGLGASFLLFNLLAWGYWMATFTGNTIGAVVSYILNKTYTFRSNVSIGSSWWKFVLVILVCYGISYGASMAIADLSSALFPRLEAFILHNGAIFLGNGFYMVTNYLGHKYFTFRSNHGQAIGKR